MFNFSQSSRLIGVLAIAAVGATACSHIKTEPLPSTANPSEEITRLESDRNQAIQRQVNVLSPTNFEKVDESLKQAKEMRDGGQKNEVVLKYLSEGRAYLKRAEDASEKGQPVLSEVLKAREAALAANAPKHAKSDFEGLDKDLRKVTKDIEDGDLRPAQKVRGELTAKYLDVELKSAKQGYLGYARELISQAKKEGAKDAAPRTLQYTEGVINNADALITVDRRNLAAVEKESSNAIQSAERLLRITREAKTSSKKDAEQMTLEVEAQANKAETLAAATNELASANASANNEANSERKAKERYDYAYAKFNHDEAEVLQEQGKVLIRLRGLNFPVGKDYVLPENYPLLAKVQDVIRHFGESKVTVEGHTDGSGSLETNASLSDRRAQAIKTYLVTNNVVPESKVQAVGYGYSKPLTSNKTKQGRDLNRRVDIIISPEENES